MKKIVRAFIACLIVAGIAMTWIMGLNYSFIYMPNKQVDIYIGKEFEYEDIKQIVKEVMGQDTKVMLQKVEIYEDMVSITVPDITEEQLSQINTKINEKYGVDNKAEELTVIQNAKIRGRELIKPYLLPCSISLAIIVLYAIIRYKKEGMGKIALKVLGFTILPQLVYLSFIAVTRIPVTRFTIPVALVIYLITEFVLFYQIEKGCKKEES